MARINEIRSITTVSIGFSRNKDDELTVTRELDPHAKARKTARIGLAEFTVWDPDDAPNRIAELAADGNSNTAHVHLLNAYSLAVMDAEPTYAQSLASGAINLADGTPVAWASKILPGRAPLKQVRGPRLFLETLKVAEKEGIAVYFLGSTPEVLKRLKTRFETELPNLRIAGLESPPYRQLDERELNDQDQRIISSGANLVWVGLGTPKQDVETARIHTSTGITTVAIGAAFDFAAGTVAEAPIWMHGSGLEWLHRFAQEPRRLWRRYTVGNIRFMWSVLANAKGRQNGNC